MIACEEDCPRHTHRCLSCKSALWPLIRRHRSGCAQPTCALIERKRTPVRDTGGDEPVKSTLADRKPSQGILLFIELCWPVARPVDSSSMCANCHSKPFLEPLNPTANESPCEGEKRSLRATTVDSFILGAHKRGRRSSRLSMTGTSSPF